MIKFSEKSRVVKNETDAFVWKVGSGYKMSREARKLLGISQDGIETLVIGTTEDGERLLIGAASKEDGNCSVNKQNVISSRKAIAPLSDFGSKFLISNEKEEGYYIMNVVVSAQGETSDTVEKELEEAN